MGERTRDFFRGQSLLLLGVTGTVGQVVLEHLLRCAPLQRLYLLTRSTPKASSTQRIIDLLQQPLFAALHKGLRDEEGEAHSDDSTASDDDGSGDGGGCRSPQSSTQSDEELLLNGFGIHVIEGDLRKEYLGLSERDHETLKANVTVVVNCAASINFEDPFPQLFDQNVVGALRVMQLAMSCEGVRSSGCFVHVSTAYANSNRSGVIEEKLYESDIDHEHEFSELGRTTGEEHERLAEQLRVRYGHPNHYTFTKCLCEHLIDSRRGDMPTLIVRPSIIGSTYKTPFKGWTNAPQGFGTLVAFRAFGASLRLPSDGMAIGDVIPSDYVSSAIIKGAVATAGRVGHLEVMHVSSSHTNPITWNELGRHAVKAFTQQNSQSKIPKKYMIGPRFVVKWCSSSRKYAVMHAMDDAAVVAGQSVAARLSDVLPSQGRQLSKLVKFLRRRQKALKLLHPFICNQWTFKTDKISQLAREDDEPDFPLDVENIDWELWCKDYLEGLCRYSLIPTLERMSARDKDPPAPKQPLKPSTFDTMSPSRMSTASTSRTRVDGAGLRSRWIVCGRM